MPLELIHEIKNKKELGILNDWLTVFFSFANSILMKNGI